MPDFDFSTLITDRAPADLEALRDLLATPMADWTAAQMAAFNQAASKGAYNYTDLNRVTACMDYLNERLTALGYVTGYRPIIVHPETPPPTPTLPEGYTELEYIESSGSQHIDTGITPNQDTQITLDYIPTEAATVAVFGSRVGVGNAAFALWIVSPTSIEDDYSSDRDTISVDTVLARTLIVKNGNQLNYGGISHEHTETTFSNQYPMALFGINTAGTVDSRRVSARLYSCSISNGDTPQRVFIPCKNADGNIGLYDQITKSFFWNFGAGAFVAGPEVPQPEPTLDPYTWYEADTPTATQMQLYLDNVAALRGALALPDETTKTPDAMAKLTQAEANSIEEILKIVKIYLTSLQKVFLRSGMTWAISGGPNYFFES